MPLEFARPESISLKSHPEFSEKWVHERIIDDPTMLGLGEVDVVTAEKRQPKAGRLDLLLHDDQLNRRYEVELMLGATDPSHIIRCIRCRSSGPSDPVLIGTGGLRHRQGLCRPYGPKRLGYGEL